MLKRLLLIGCLTGLVLAQNTHVYGGRVIEGGVNVLGSSSGTNTYTVTPSPALATYTANVCYTVYFVNASTGASTLNISGLGANAITLRNGTALIAGDISATSTHQLCLNNAANSFTLDHADNAPTGSVSSVQAHTGAVVLTTNDLSTTEYVAGGGTAQAQTATLVPAATSLTAGLIVRWLPTAANSGAAPTLAVSGLTATAITKCGTTALAANDLTTTAVAQAIYDGTQFQLMNPQAATCGGSGGTSYACWSSATQLCEEDDFISSTQQFAGVGQMGWIQSPATGGTWSQISSASAYGSGLLAGHPGIIDGNTSGTINTLLYLEAVGGASAFAAADNFDVIGLFNIGNGNATDVAQIVAQFGVRSVAPPSDAAPVNGVYLYAINTTSATDWMFQTCAASSCDTAVDTGTVTAYQAWVAVEMKRISSTTVGVQLATTLGGLPYFGATANFFCITTAGSAPVGCGATNTLSATHIPTASLGPYFLIQNTEAFTKHLDIDYVRVVESSLTR